MKAMWNSRQGNDISFRCRRASSAQIVIRGAIPSRRGRQPHSRSGWFSNQVCRETRGFRMTTAFPPVPAAWHPDPSGRNQYRYWDGVAWTDWVANDGVQATDPLHLPVAPSAAQKWSTAAERLTSNNLPEREKATRTGYLLLGADGHPNTEVAGEFARMDSIHKTIGRKPKKDEEIECTDLIAALVPEPTNPHDRNAVMVQINAQHVGSLEKEVAALYVSAIRDVWDSGHVAATGARIWASARNSWDSSRKLKYVARVSIALSEPHLVLPLNEPPAGAYSILPWGHALQVTGEEQHQYT